jgi:hypothetical protein
MTGGQEARNPCVNSLQKLQGAAPLAKKLNLGKFYIVTKA